MNQPNRSATKNATQLGMFAKYWQPGTVKTRLAATIGNEAAARIHRMNIKTLAARFRNVADNRLLAISPFEKRPEFEQLIADSGDDGEGNWQLQPQSAGDLGERMSDYFSAAFAARHARVVLIGSDSPTLPTATITAAFESLRSHDVVLGPAEDGGYYLVGARNETPEIFDGIEWSSERVWDQTVKRLDQNDSSWKALATCYDVDHIEDLKRLHEELLNAEFQHNIWNELRDVVDEALRST